MNSGAMQVLAQGPSSPLPHGERESAKFSRGWVLGVSIFSAVSCLAGGLELVLWHAGNRFLPPLDLLRFTPFHDYLVPGLILALVVGGAQLGCAVASYRRAASAPLAAVLAGGTLAGWIIAEAAMLRVVSSLHALYLLTGLVLLALGATAALRQGEPRARWILLVTTGEVLGFAVPAVTGIMLSMHKASDTQELLALGLAGACEGLLLGAAQARAWPLPVRRMRYAWLTALAASLVWLCAMSFVHLMAAGEAARGLAIAFGVVALPFALLAIGTAQWLELRQHAPRAWRHIAWTALAWTLALPCSFAPGPFVDEATPFAPQLALWSMGGLLMALVMALVTWCGVRQLTARAQAALATRARAAK